ncbi:hypothetical protein M434DRAFT_122192 [Hypoxylon sp. CO27-5]|nr:hypothetical protein M434DRAFT_122192 [Hypoxylon sp. CO27-5]
MHIGRGCPLPWYMSKAVPKGLIGPVLVPSLVLWVSYRLFRLAQSVMNSGCRRTLLVIFLGLDRLNPNSHCNKRTKHRHHLCRGYRLHGALYPVQTEQRCH